MSSGMVQAASTGLMGRSGGIAGMVGGGGITGGGNTPGGFGGFREGGGPVEAGKSYVAGESGPEILALYEPPGKELHQSFDGRAFYADAPTPADDGRPSLAGMASSPLVARVPVKAKAAAAKPREMTYEELLRAADKLDAELRETHAQRMAAGPALARMK